jgi:uncharacterized cupin superfamily protein
VRRFSSCRAGTPPLQPNRTRVLYLEIGDRSEGDEVFYPNDDLQAGFGANGQRVFLHKDGTSY